MKHVGLVLLFSFSIFSCTSPAATAVNNDFTLGKVQSQLTNGMNSSQVVALFGSPNLVTSRKEGGETWTYDKISREAEASQASGLGAGASGRFFGIFGGGRSKSSVSNKNLTLIVVFDENGTVVDHKYQSVKY
tara:strand:- start:38 stop:436 length:399 start_codon:yes stop_codon:yes gene_type:complete